MAKPLSSSSPTSRNEDRRKVIHRFLGGTVGGVLQAATSHPFDTIKSRVQRGVFPNVTTCVKETWHHEGLRGFYRGVTPPLFLGGIYNSLLFSINQRMMNLLTPVDHDKNKSLPLWRTAFAGQLTAPVYVLCITPMEKVKVQLQVQGQGGKETSFSGPLSCCSSILKTEGWRGFLSGYIPTVLSRIVGLPFYFGGYQIGRETLLSTTLAQSTFGHDIVAPVLSGILAGILFWTSNYPFDFLKTQLQASRVKLSLADVARETYKKGGFKGFYRGFAACLLRSAPANASVWLGIEYTTKFLNARDW